MIFLYDGEELIGARYRDNNYYYVKNAMGDVIGVVNENGEQIVSYAYNAWGKVIVNQRADNLSDSDYHFARYNPMLYRSYYYDDSTSQYYLQSRYYMPNICRFVNADIPDIAQQSKHQVNGLNLFAYCNNNPVNNADYTGYATHGGGGGKIYNVTVRLYKIHIDVALGGYVYTYGANISKNGDGGNFMWANEKRYLNEHSKCLKKLVFSVNKTTYNKFYNFYNKTITGNATKLSETGMGGGTRYRINSGYFKKYRLLFANCATFVYAAFYYSMPFKMTSIASFFKSYPTLPSVVFAQLAVLKKAWRM